MRSSGCRDRENAVSSVAIRVGMGLLLSTTLLTPVAAQDATSPAAAPAPATGAKSAEQVLLERARYAVSRSRPEEAAQALQQLLSSNPNHPEGLFEAGQLAARSGNVAEAQRYLDRLRAVQP